MLGPHNQSGKDTVYSLREHGSDQGVEHSFEASRVYFSAQGLGAVLALA